LLLGWDSTGATVGLEHYDGGVLAFSPRATSLSQQRGRHVLGDGDVQGPVEGARVERSRENEIAYAQWLRAVTHDLIEVPSLASGAARSTGGADQFMKRQPEARPGAAFWEKPLRPEPKK
jgi:hypothetical protein